MTRPKSKALVRRSPSKPVPRKTALVRRPRVTLEAPGVQVAPTVRYLTEEIALDLVALDEIKFTKDEDRILSEPVPEDQLEIKPNGAVYLSHVGYARWFGRAFGRTGWALVPVTKPLKADQSVVCLYVLKVHGKNAAIAWGEQEYFANNRDQSYGDALEATRGSALRRCAKHLGVGLELWDRKFTTPWLVAHAVRVRVEYDTKDGQKKTKIQWRRPSDQPFRDEIGLAERRTAPPSGTDPAATITPQELKRFWSTATRCRRQESTVKEWLAGLGIDSSREILARDYARLVAALEAPGPLPGLRVPGEEG